MRKWTKPVTTGRPDRLGSEQSRPISIASSRRLGELRLDVGDQSLEIQGALDTCRMRSTVGDLYETLPQPGGPGFVVGE